MRSSVIKVIRLFICGFKLQFGCVSLGDTFMKQLILLILKTLLLLPIILDPAMSLNIPILNLTNLFLDKLIFTNSTSQFLGGVLRRT